MKKTVIFIISALIITLCLNVFASANMAAPLDADKGTTVTFEKNDVISVTSEVLDIVVRRELADITATYRMKNTSEEAVSTPSMFVAPSMEYSEVVIKIGGEDVPFEAQDMKVYAHHEEEYITSEGWEYKIVESESGYYYTTVATVRFDISFAPGEEKEVSVRYLCKLGGYPHLDWSAKCGIIEYYLRPAAKWKDFSDLTINLTLSKDMPVIKSSTLQFNKVGEREYVYHSDRLPPLDLEIIIDQTKWQEFTTSFKSPYFFMNIMMFLPGIIVMLIIAVAVVLVVRKAMLRK